MNSVKIDKSLCDERTGNIISALNEIKNTIKEVRSEALANNTILAGKMDKIMTNDLVHIDAKLVNMEMNASVLAERVKSVSKQVSASNANKKMLLSIFGNVIVIILLLVQYLGKVI